MKPAFWLTYQTFKETNKQTEKNKPNHERLSFKKLKDLILINIRKRRLREAVSKEETSSQPSCSFWTPKMRQNEINTVATRDTWRIPNWSSRSSINRPDLRIPSGCFLLLPQQDAHLASCIEERGFAWRLHKIWGWATSWVSFSFTSAGWCFFFLTPNIRTAHVCSFGTVASQARAAWEKEKPLLMHDVLTAQWRLQMSPWQNWPGLERRNENTPCV